MQTGKEIKVVHYKSHTMPPTACENRNRCLQYQPVTCQHTARQPFMSKKQSQCSKVPRPKMLKCSGRSSCQIHRQFMQCNYLSLSRLSKFLPVQAIIHRPASMGKCTSKSYLPLCRLEKLHNDGTGWRLCLIYGAHVEVSERRSHSTQSQSARHDYGRIERETFNELSSFDTSVHHCCKSWQLS